MGNTASLVKNIVTQKNIKKNIIGQIIFPISIFF